jgi:hypothetical protein
MNGNYCRSINVIEGETFNSAEPRHFGWQLAQKRQFAFLGGTIAKYRDFD